MIRLACPKCKERLELDDNTRGQVGQCPDCGTRFRIPVAQGKSEQRTPGSGVSSHAVPAGQSPSGTPADRNELQIIVACACGKSIVVKDTLAGTYVRCPACKQPLPVPRPAEAIDLTCNDEENSECYQVRPEDALLEGRRPGHPSRTVRSFSGAISRIRLSNECAPVNCVAYSPDHCYALAGLDQRVYVLNVRDGKRAYKLKHHADDISSLAFSSDGKFALAADARGNVLLWEVASARLLRWLDWHRAAVEAIAFSPTGGYAVSGDVDGFLCLWDLQIGKPIQRFGERDRQVTSLAFSADGRYVFYATSSSKLRIWDVVNAQEFARLRCDGLVTAVTFGLDSMDLRLVAVGPTGNVLGKQLNAWQWDFPRLTPKECLTDPSKTEAAISCVTVTPNGTRAVTAGEIRFERSKKAGLLPRLPRDVMLLEDLADLADSKNRRCIEVWSIATGHELHTMEGSEHKVCCLAVSSDGCRLISGDNDGTVMIWGLPG